MASTQADVEELDKLIQEVRAKFALVEESRVDFDRLLGEDGPVERGGVWLLRLVRETQDAAEKLYKAASAADTQLDYMGWRRTNP